MRFKDWNQKKYERNGNMKKFVIMMLAAAMTLCTAYAFAAEQAAESDASNSILAQVQANKAANKAKADKAAVQSEDKKPEKTEAAQQKNPAAEKVDAIVTYESGKAAKQNAKEQQNKGTTNAQQPAAKTETKPAPVKTVVIPPAQEQPEKTQPKKTEPAKAEPKPAQPVQPKPAEPSKQPAQQPPAPAPNAGAGSAEVPADRPLNPTSLNAGVAETVKSFIVTPEWLKANQGSVILVDARPESLYDGGHLPGAVNAPWTYFANVNAPQGTEKWGVLWAPATMGKRIGNLGINGSKTVVVYDDAGGWGQSAYVVWILRQAGIKNGKVLEGGIGSWKSSGGKIVKGKQTNKAVAFSVTKFTPNYTIDTEWINNNLGKPGLAIIDVRTEPEYLGKIRPFQEKRAGHLPGAINIPREAFMNADNTIKSADDIKAMLSQHGITQDQEIICYDTAGVRGAFVTMVLRLADYTKSLNYDAGFQAWAGNAELPLVKP